MVAWLGRQKSTSVYYWVPAQFQVEFRNLCLHAVAIRGDVAVAPIAYEVTVDGFLNFDVDGQSTYVQAPHA